MNEEPDIVDRPPEPDPPAYPESPKAPTSAAASVEGGTGDGKTNRRLEEIERRLKVYEDARTVFADAEMVACIKKELLGAINAAKAAALEEANQTTNERLETFYRTFYRKLRELLDERFRNLAEQQEANIGRVQDDLDKVRKDLGGEINGVRGLVEESKKRTTGLVATNAEFEQRIAVIREDIGALNDWRKHFDSRLKEIEAFIARTTGPTD